MRASRLVAAVSGGLLVTAALAACTSTVPMQPAAGSNDPACANVIVNLPSSLSSQSRQWTDAQGTAAWGKPATILLTCGLSATKASNLPCVSVDGVDWLVDGSAAPKYRFTSFGRTPAVEVYLSDAVTKDPAQQVHSSSTLSGLARAVSTLPKNGAVCQATTTE